MAKHAALFGQINIVSGDPAASLAFYRRLGVDMPEDGVLRTQTGIHHVNAADDQDRAVDFGIDSTAFAQVWNAGWKGRGGLGGRVVVGFQVASREAVDEIYRDMTAAGHRGLQEPWNAFWGARYAILEDPDGIAVGVMSPSSDKFRSRTPEV